MRVGVVMLVLMGCGGDAAWQKLIEGDPSHIVELEAKVAMRREPVHVTFVVDSPRADVPSALINLMSKRSSDYRFGLAVAGAQCGVGRALPPGTDPAVVIGTLLAPPSGEAASWTSAMRGVALPEESGAVSFVILVTSNAADACDADPATIVKELRRKHLPTIVIQTGPSSATLEATAAAGFARTCPLGTDAECAPGVCDSDTGMCSQHAYSAPDPVALEAVLEKLFTPLAQDVCAFSFEPAPSSPERIEVFVERERLNAPNDYELTESFTRVRFKHRFCDRMRNSGAANPTHVVIRIDTRP
ncbi:MAG: hypothetical protein JNK82_16880 [Myxococcaceae bacterium]|nr:hypothetical protein [Myxococcaceae bacterium]